MLSTAPKKMTFPQHDELANRDIISEAVDDASNETLLHCLDLLLNDERLLAEAARRSYRHQLGFRKIVLMENAEGRCLRLHVWDSASTSIEDIHSHCADFHSRVVLGTLDENSFYLKRGKTHARFRYCFDAIAGHSVAVKEGFTGVCLRERRTISRGCSYSKCATDLHNVSNVMQGTVTVSAWGPRNREAIVLKNIHALSEDCAASSGMPPEEMHFVLRNIKERLGSE